MFNKSIGYRLTLYISLAVISVFVAFISANYLFNLKLYRENTLNKAIGKSMEVNALVNNKIVTTSEIASNISEQFFYFQSKGDVQLLLERILVKYPFINAVYANVDSVVPFENNYFYAFSNGDALHYKQSKEPVFVCHKEMELFAKIKNLTTSGWTEPYRCPEKGNVVVAYHTPLYYKTENGGENFAGQIIAELSLMELNDAINQIDVGERGYTFLITREGDYITHPNDSNILRRNVYSLPSKSLNSGKIDLKDILLNGKTGWAVVYPDIINYEKSWVYYTPINENRWFLLFITPYKELFFQLYWETVRLIIFALIGILLIFLIIKYITKKLVDPLSDVTSRLSALSGTEEKNGSTLNEVQRVSDTLEFLKEWFDQYRIASEQEELKSLRHKQDLQQASEIQQSLIKKSFPAFPNRKDIDLYAIYEPARVVSGDLFDYFFIDEDNLAFTIGDVSGKGIPAGIFMSVAQTIIRNKAIAGKKAKDIVIDANTELSTSNKHQYFLTLFLGVLNLKTGVLNYCNAAHDFPFVLKSNGSISELKETHGLPLGLYAEKEYKDSNIIIGKGDTIVLYTDGVTELLNEAKNQFGVERFKENLVRLAGLDPTDMVKTVHEVLKQFKGEAPQADDMSLFSIKYTP